MTVNEHSPTKCMWQAWELDDPGWRKSQYDTGGSSKPELKISAKIVLDTVSKNTWVNLKTLCSLLLDIYSRDVHTDPTTPRLFLSQKKKKTETELTAGVLKDISKTHKRLGWMLFNQMKRGTIQIFKGVIFFKATNNLKTNKSLSCCQLGASRGICGRLTYKRYFCMSVSHTFVCHMHPFGSTQLAAAKWFFLFNCLWLWRRGCSWNFAFSLVLSD